MLILLGFCPRRIIGERMQTTNDNCWPTMLVVVSCSRNGNVANHVFSHAFISHGYTYSLNEASCTVNLSDKKSYNQ